MDNRNEKLVKLVKMALIVAVYVAVTMATSGISYLNIQFRIGEVLVLLAFIDPVYVIPLTIACFITNIGSPMGVADMVVGTSATLIATLAISKTKNLFVATLWPTIVNAILVGAELYYVLNLPFWLSALEVAVGEFVVVSILGYVVFKFILNNDKLVNTIKLNA